jgi:hypothetical protein
MNSMNRKLLVIAAVLLLAGCASQMRVRTDFDPKADFSNYRTFAWMSDDPLIGADDESKSVSPLNRQRIVNAIEAQLIAKGFQKAADRNSADFVLSYTVGARDRIDLDSYPVPYRGPWTWGWPPYARDVDVTTYREGTLAIDIFDGRTRQPVWHGAATKRITEQDVARAAEQIPPAVRDILANFPPRS